MSWALSQCLCVVHSCPFQKGAFAVTIAGAEHLCLRAHTCVLQTQRVRGQASACGDILMIAGRHQCVAHISVPLGVVGGLDV